MFFLLWNVKIIKFYLWKALFWGSLLLAMLSVCFKLVDGSLLCTDQTENLHKRYILASLNCFEQNNLIESLKLYRKIITNYQRDAACRREGMASFIIVKQLILSKDQPPRHPLILLVERIHRSHPYMLMSSGIIPCLQRAHDDGSL